MAPFGYRESEQAPPYSGYLTLPSRVVSEPEPSATEDTGVTISLDLARRLRAIGGQRLLLARLDWERLFTSANPVGAPAPSVAKATLTRDSRRRWDLARKARRGVRPAYLLAKAIIGK